jgi:hypothetical protein
MLIYSLIYSLLALLALTRKKNTYIFIFVFTLLSLFLTLSYTNGIDWVNYQYAYEYDPYQTRGIEYGYTILVFLFKSLGINFEIFKFIVLTFDLYFILKFIFKFSPYPLFVITILFQTFLLGNFFEPAIRQMQAIVVFLFASKFLLSKNNKAYFITILFGAFFHQSALLMLALPLVLKYINFTSISLAALTLFLLADYFYDLIEIISHVAIFSSYSFYLDKYFLEGVNLNAFNIAKLIMYLLPLFLLRNYNLNDGVVVLLRKLSYIFIFFYLMQFSVMLFYRMNYFFVIFYVSYVSYMLISIKSKQISQLLLVCYIAIHSISLFRGITYYKEKDSMKYYPYTNYIYEYIAGNTFANPQDKINHRIESRKVDLNAFMKGK